MIVVGLVAVGIAAVLYAAWALGGAPGTKRGIARAQRRNLADLRAMRGPQLIVMRGGKR
jgi:hypothetical protein